MDVVHGEEIADGGGVDELHRRVEASMLDSTAAWMALARRVRRRRKGRSSAPAEAIGELVIDLNDLSAAAMLVRVGNAD